MMYAPPELIETDRLVLRRPKPEDAAPKYEYSRDPLVARYMDWSPHTDMDGAVALVEGAAALWESGEEHSWVVTVKPGDLAVGGIACFVQGDSAEIGFVLAREYWNRGYATEAASAVLAWLTSLGDLIRIWATCDVENAASARVLEKIGMLQEGVLRNWAVRPNIAPGVPRDALLYSWVRED